jgi:hypothetical protein
MSRLAAPIAVLLLLAALVAGCGSGGSSSGGSSEGGSSGGTSTAGGGGPETGAPAKRPRSAQQRGAPLGSQVKHCDSDAADAELLRATGVPCGPARQAMFSWQRAAKCAPARGASHSACSIAGGYRCQSAETGKGLEVSCSAPGRAVAFRTRSAG